MNEQEERFLRLKQVLEIIPISASSWWQGCKDGRFPQPIKLGPRTTVWRASEIQEMLKQFTGDKEMQTEK